MKLTVERLFADPPLNGQLPEDLRFAPHHDFITYRARSQEDGERMDLWRINSAGNHEIYVDARDIDPSGTRDTASLSPAEQAERERRRQFTTGINQYQWHPGKPWLLIPMDGQAYLGDMSEQANDQPAWQPLCPAGSRQSAIQFSPAGRYLSYVRDNNLYVLPLTDTLSQAGQTDEWQITHDGSPTLSNGLADFLAAEEMHRFSGYWWSKDEQYLAYCKVDDADVAVSYRLQVDAGQAHTVAQRYPYPGCTNPRVALHLFHLPSRQDTCIWRSPDDDEYLARVHAADKGFIIESQDRLQQHLQIRRYNLLEQTWSEMHREAADTWINLTDDLHPLAHDQLLFSSEARGNRQAIVISADGTRTLAGPTHINNIMNCTEHAAYATGWQHNPGENHLFRIMLDGSGFQQLTEAGGWHEVTLDAQCRRFIDRYSNETTPVQVTLQHLTDEIPETPLWHQHFTADHPYAPYLDNHITPVFGELPAADGQLLHYRLTPPANINGRHATIVYVYGGPGAQKVRREWSPLLLQLFAHQGFAVLELDNRGSTNRGRHFEAPLYRKMSEVETQDQITGLRVLQDYAWADTQRIGIFGHSYGGYMALMGLCRAPRQFKAGVAVAPVCDWQLYDSHYTERYMGLPHDNADGYAQANVLSHLPAIQSPLLLIHGMADDNVLFTHSTMIMSALQQQDSQFELMTYPGAKHALQERHVAVHRFRLILEFFARHLQN